MSQEKIMDVIRANPGIEQIQLYEKIGQGGGVVSRQLRSLMNYRMIRRVSIGRTFLLYPVGD